MGSSRRAVFSVLAAFAAFWLMANFLLPLLSPFLLGAGLALAAEPMVRFLSRRAHMPRAVSTAVGVSMAFCFLAMVLLMLCAFALRQLKTLAHVLPDLEGYVQSGLALVQSRLLDLASHAPGGVRPLLEDNVRTLLADSGSLLGKLTAWLLGLAGSILTHVPDSALGLGTTILSAFLISAKLPHIKAWLRRRIPREQLRAVLETARRMRQVLGKWLLAQCKLMSVTFVILAAGLTLLRIPYAFVWSVVIAFVDLLPVLGTGTVLLPWALILFLQSDIGRGVGILGLYAVIALTRSLLEPRLVGKELGLDPLVTLMALYAGYRLWGFPGLILAPVLAVAAQQLLAAQQ